MLWGHTWVPHSCSPASVHCLTCTRYGWSVSQRCLVIIPVLGATGRQLDSCTIGLPVSGAAVRPLPCGDVRERSKYSHLVD